MKKFIPAAFLLLLFLPSCLGNDDDDSLKQYKEWYDKNMQYLTDAEAKTENGVKYYERIVPVWSPGNYVLVKWHNDRSLTEKNLQPLSNSTVDLKYELQNINGDVLDSSYAATTYGDSIARFKPNGTVLGFWTTLTSMHEGDSVTAVVPYNAGYGASGSGSIPPYSTLIFNIKLKKVVAYELPRPAN